MSRPARHRAPEPAPQPATAARSRLRDAGPRLWLPLVLLCAALLIAAPLALLFSGGSEESGREADSVFTREPGSDGDGPDGGGPGVATEASRTPDPPAPGTDPALGVPAGADPGAGGAGGGAAGSGGSGGAWTGGGAPGGTQGGGGSAGSAAPAGTQPRQAGSPAPEPAPAGGGGGGGTQPAEQPPAQQPQQPPREDPEPCGCDENGDGLDDITGAVIGIVKDPPIVGGLLP